MRIVGSKTFSFLYLFSNMIMVMIGVVFIDWQAGDEDDGARLIHKEKCHCIEVLVSAKKFGFLDYLDEVETGGILVSSNRFVNFKTDPFQHRWVCRWPSTWRHHKAATTSTLFRPDESRRIES